MGLAGFNRVRRILAEGGTVAEQDRFQHISGKVEHAEPGTKRHDIFMRSQRWQKVPYSSESAEVEEPVAQKPANKVEVPSGNGDDLDGMSADELKARAAELNIEGRSKMNKQQLADAIRGAQKG